MRKKGGILPVVLFLFLTMSLCGRVYALSDDLQARLDRRVEDIKTWGKEPIIINAVKAANAEGKTLDEIKAIDKQWIASGQAEIISMVNFINDMLSNACSQYLLKEKKIISPEYAEIFVMDNQGANVALTDKTSDYWQGDENKFIKTFSGGKGVVFVDKAKFDESSNSFSVQVSVPVLDPDTGGAIGAITVGVDLNKLKSLKE
ncbi:MAG: PDC sensor domain-containing protein [Candidatus Omnitrophota bacterium]